MQRIARGLLTVSFGIALVFGVGQLASSPMAKGRGGPCVCPKVYAPVVCANGKTYSNACVAECRGQTDCEFVGVEL